MLASRLEVQTAKNVFAVLNQRGAGATEQLEWARDYYTSPRIAKYRAVGFKTKLVDVLDLAGFTRLLQEKQCRIIHMKRLNRIKAVVSRINARRLWETTGYWNLYKESDRLPPMTIDPEEFQTYLCEREEADRILDEYVSDLQLPTLLVRYEDLLLNRDEQLQQVIRFLDISQKPLEERTKKNTSDDLRDIVSNLDELKANYVGTRYELMFDEVLVPSDERITDT